MRSRVTVGLCFLAAFGCAAGAYAQEAPRAGNSAAYSLHGTVVASDGSTLSDADVVLLERDARKQYSRSDSGGRFRFTGLTTHSATIQVRRLGFQPRSMDVEITRPDRSANVLVKMEPMVAKLDAMNVDDEGSGGPNSLLAGFYDRARTNSFGHFIDEAMFARLRPQWVSDAMRRVPGVVVKPTRRIGNTVRIRGCGVPGESPEAVGPLVWLDGVRLPGAELDEVTQISDVAAIEIYNSFAGIPAQFFDRSAVCGTILVWTRTR